MLLLLLFVPRLVLASTVEPPQARIVGQEVTPTLSWINL